MYTYSRFTSLYSRNQHSIVKQVYANKKKNMGGRDRQTQGNTGCRLQSTEPALQRILLEEGEPLISGQRL